MKYKQSKIVIRFDTGFNYILFLGHAHSSIFLSYNNMSWNLNIEK